jgi:hypothetical protein
MVMYMKMAVFWNVAPCSLVDFDRFSEELTAFIIRAMIMEAASSSETVVSIH